jgi:oxidase EvaA
MVGTRVRRPDAGESAIEVRIARSTTTFHGVVDSAAGVLAWLAECGERLYTAIEPRALRELSGWVVEPDTGNIGHERGTFFRVEGLDVRIPGAPIERWNQPIIRQPEIGILGILVKDFGGVLHCLMQAKAEPGNCNGVQLSPTVQATRSNYTGAHRGKAVPYLDYFRDAPAFRRIVDVRQSEQGAWFRHKRNRNMIVEVTDDVEPLDGFCWLTLGQVQGLLAVDDVVNMDTRTVLSCLPTSGLGPAGGYRSGATGAAGGDGFWPALVRSYGADEGSAHAIGEVLSWITAARTRHDEVRVQEIPLRSVRGWRHVNGCISHEDGLFFDVVGVSVRAVGREVARWDQPMFEPHGTGLVAMLVRQIDGVLHALMHARVEPGYLDILELAPTVQCTPDTYDRLGIDKRPAFLDEVLGADPARIRFDAVHSEEGGRFLRARTRYVVVEADPDVAAELAPHYRWLTLHQLDTLLRHSHYLNVQARSLVACLHGLAGRALAGPAGQPPA